MTQSQQRALTDDLSGSLQRVAVQLDADQFEKDIVLRLAAYGSLLKSFESSTVVVVLADEAVPKRVRDWLDTLVVECQLKILDVPGKKLSAGRTWMRDAFLCGTLDGQRCYFRPWVSVGNGEPASYLSASDGIPVHRICDVSLDGGDSIVAHDFRLVGIDAVRRTMSLKDLHCDFRVALNRLQTLDPRPMTLVGYRPSALTNPALAFGRELDRRIRRETSRRSGTIPSWRNRATIVLIALRTVAELLRIYLLNELIEDWAHIDVVVSPTGSNDPTKPQLIVAELPKPTSKDGDEINAWQRLNALALHLESSGFRVGRNPTAFNWETKTTLWYNNVILQSDPPIVWLPHYGPTGGTYAAVDAANAKIWSDLGYSVRPVPGWNSYVGLGGAIRCATNVIERAMVP